jgi:hypothetical protein
LIKEIYERNKISTTASNEVKNSGMKLSKMKAEDKGDKKKDKKCC